MSNRGEQHAHMRRKADPEEESIPKPRPKFPWGNEGKQKHGFGWYSQAALFRIRTSDLEPKKKHGCILTYIALTATKTKGDTLEPSVIDGVELEDIGKAVGLSGRAVSRNLPLLESLELIHVLRRPPDKRMNRKTWQTSRITILDIDTIQHDVTSCCEREQAIEILNYLNRKAETNHKPTKKTIDLIVGRIRYTNGDIEGIKLVISNKVEEWTGTDVEKYLRPRTLFEEGKFEGYYQWRENPATRWE